MWLSSGLITRELSDSAPQRLFRWPATCHLLLIHLFSGNSLQPIKSRLNVPDFYYGGLKVREAGLFKFKNSCGNLAVRSRDKRCSFSAGVLFSWFTVGCLAFLKRRCFVQPCSSHVTHRKKCTNVWCDGYILSQLTSQYMQRFELLASRNAFGLFLLAKSLKVKNF